MEILNWFRQFNIFSKKTKYNHMTEKRKREDILSFEDGQPFKKYKILTKPGSDAGKTANPLGEGGSSQVYLAEQILVEDENVVVKRAIKFFVFRDDIKQENGLSGKVSEENFKEEIANISKFNHENIIKVIDGGMQAFNASKIPFIVTDYVEGNALKDILEDEKHFKFYIKTEDQILEVLSQICAGLVYLHKNGFYHCDIAPKNIFIRSLGNKFQVIIGDLGVGKTLNGSTVYKSKLKVIGSKKYMPVEALDVINQEVPFEDFKKLQPSWDLYSLKKTFQEILEAYEKYYTNKTPWYQALKRMMEEHFSSTEEIADEVMWINPTNRQFHNVSELSEADSSSNGYKELQPIRSVWLTDRVKAIIRHQAYSRLKKTPQLLSANTFNPGSNHSRYEHALGTYEHMRLTLVSMLRSESFLGLLNKTNIELGLTAALLSNITKFPFSFVIEEIQIRNPKDFKTLNSTTLLKEILEFKHPLKNIKSIKEVLASEFPNVDYNLLIDIIGDQVKAGSAKSNKIINKLLHCTIDMRVLDFLQRDSYHIGISHGAHINFDSLISNLRLHNDTIAIDGKGVTDVEQVVTLRYWLYKRIYWNTLNRAYTAALTHIFILLNDKSEGFEARLHEIVLFSDPPTILKFLQSEIENLNSTAYNKYLNLEHLLSGLTSETPRVFKELFLINQSESSSAEFKTICSQFGSFGCNDIEQLRVELESKLSPLFSFQENQVNILIDIPPDEKNKKLGSDITVLKGDGDESQIEKISGIISGISRTFDENLRFLRVYINPFYEVQPDKRLKAKEIIKQFFLDKITK